MGQAYYTAEKVTSTSANEKKTKKVGKEPKHGPTRINTRGNIKIIADMEKASLFSTMALLTPEIL